MAQSPDRRASTGGHGRGRQQLESQMSRFARSLGASTLAAAILAVGALPALARSPSVSTTGNDISWPQCGGSYPAGQAFGIVGVTGGLANTLNPCLASELTWALSSSGASAPGVLPKAALWVNTADPGAVVPVVADWPTDNLDPSGASEGSGTPDADPYGTCTGANDQACAWQYGWDRAIQDMRWASAAASLPATTPWWLDVETGNTWETGSSGLANNVADLEGMVAAFTWVGKATTVGIYSTSTQWSQIVGGLLPPTSALRGLPDWIPGARTLSGAQSTCRLAGFTGPVRITQWFGKPFDGDYACP
jgi:hypothetical protein